jgi:hypothetical protein
VTGNFVNFETIEANKTNLAKFVLVRVLF